MMTQPSSNRIIALCQENGFPYEENTDGTIVFGLETYRKLKSHPDVGILYLNSSGLLAGNLYDEGGIHYGDEIAGKLVITKNLEGGQYITHVTRDRSKIERFAQMNTEVSSDTPSIPFMRPQDCNVINFTDVKVPILINRKRGTRAILKNNVTSFNIEEIVALDKEEKYGNPLIGCLIMIAFIGILFLIFWMFV